MPAQHSSDVAERKPGTPTVAILGAGIMGSSVALMLARKNMRSVLIDAAPAPFTAASRWNEGKIHLGYLYAADPSLATARKLIPGGLNFARLVGEMLDQPPDTKAITDHNDTYLIHSKSVTDADSAFALAQRISDLSLEHPDANRYFVPLDENRPRRLTKKELGNRCDTSEIIAGYEVPERSLSTTAIADNFVAALASCAQIESAMQQRVISVRKANERNGRWMVETITPTGCRESLGPFDAVVNALWEGRGEIDASIGIVRSASWTHRYRVSVFATTTTPVDLKSTVIAVGPFGDIKNYDGYNLYLSWYEAGLLMTSHEMRPPLNVHLNEKDRLRITEATLERLELIIPDIQKIRSSIKTSELRGGWVYTAGTGSLSDPESDLHKRHDIGLAWKEGYYSVDTGKYSMAPWIALQVANAIEESASS